jgi:uncharacterized membrane protein (UPF0182 family)
MRVIIFLLAFIAFFAWLSFELKDRQRDLAQILLVVAVLLAVVLFGALFGLYGA